MNKLSKIYIAGHKGLLGSAIFNRLKQLGYQNIITRNRSELDLLNKEDVSLFFETYKPEYVFMAAGKAGNLKMCINKPAYLYELNTHIQNNIFSSASKNDVKNLIYFASSCIYPLNSQQPIKESEFLNGKLEKETEFYAASKISGILACKAYNKEYHNNNNRYIAVVPNTVYGPNDHFDLENSHVFSALIMRFYEALRNDTKELILWGSGKPKREFIFNEDVADASIFLIKNYKKLKNTHYNVGTGVETSIIDLSAMLANKIGYNGNIMWDKTQKDGRSSKLLNSTEINNLGWSSKVNLNDGINRTCEWYYKNVF